jgi:redox-sensitive bicupin YhaK (pirin superfamily)
MPASDGAGVRLTRVIGTPQLEMLDPFLMLDEFGTDKPEDYLAGFQLWVNLPAKDKMTKPRYQDIDPENVPVVERPDGVKVKVLVGSFDGVTGPVSNVATDPLYLDLTLPERSRPTLPWLSPWRMRPASI